MFVTYRLAAFAIAAVLLLGLPKPAQARPDYFSGKLEIDGKLYDYGTGGVPGYFSIPYGSFPITPDAIGPWGRRHGALGINDDSIYDEQHHRMTEGIELHPSRSDDPDKLISEGCIAIRRSEWPALRKQILAMIRAKGGAILNVTEHGISITPPGQPS